jgi:branched-chain amino acid transport system permease protein
MAHEAAYALQQALNTLQLVAFYLPLALAFAMLQGITRRIFLSFGDFAMFGSFAAVYICFASLLRGWGDVTAACLSLLAAGACGAALGLVVARLAMGSTLLRAPLAYMIASLGLGIFIEELMRLETQSRDIWVPPLFPGETALALDGPFPVHISTMAAFAICVSLLACISTGLLLKVTRFGRAWQAVSQAPVLAALCGLNELAVITTTFALGGALAGVTGWTASISYGGANFGIGLMAGFKAMFASVIGGFGTLRGAVAGTLVLAAAEVCWSAAFSTAYRDVAVFGLAVVLLIFRPEGILGSSSHRESE